MQRRFRLTERTFLRSIYVAETVLILPDAVDRRPRLTPLNQGKSKHYHADRRPICAPSNNPKRCRTDHPEHRREPGSRRLAHPSRRQGLPPPSAVAILAERFDHALDIAVYDCHHNAVRSVGKATRVIVDPYASKPKRYCFSYSTGYVIGFREQLSFCTKW